nr:DUF262 domain-containing protein [uncultured Massilia sp.]
MYALSHDRLTVASTSLDKLFSNEDIPSNGHAAIRGALHLPEYQRPYRWDAQLVRELYQDILDHFAPENGNAAHDYYLGSIILHQQAADGRPRLNIIDGQQRLTSMALLCALAGMAPVPDLNFRAPESRQRIAANATALHSQVTRPFDLARINVTLVVTRSEDDAYRFFETQNSGGVRLTGADIIKAHHLRAIDKASQDDYAHRWEDMRALQGVLDSVMRARHWQSLQWRNLASQRLEPLVLRQQIVHELAQATGETSEDACFSQVRLRRTDAGWDGPDSIRYAMRQPLDAGVNTVHYLAQFHDLHTNWCSKTVPAPGSGFAHYYHVLVAQSDASPFLTRLYDCALCMYISQFGDSQVLEASLRLFRVVFSPRLENKKAVREATVQHFVREHPVLDWIASSYTHKQLMNYLKQFTYTVAPDHLGTRGGIKRRFVDIVLAALSIPMAPTEGEDVATMIAARFDTSVQAAIDKIVAAAAGVRT